MFGCNQSNYQKKFLSKSGPKFLTVFKFKQFHARNMMANAQSHSFINFLTLYYINITEKKLKPRFKAIDMQQVISTYDKSSSTIKL